MRGIEAREVRVMTARSMKPSNRSDNPAGNGPDLTPLKTRNAHLLSFPVNGRDLPAYYLCYPGTRSFKEGIPLDKAESGG